MGAGHAGWRTRRKKKGVQGEFIPPDLLPHIVAPIGQGERIGTLRVRLGEQVIAERPLVALQAVEQAGWFGRTWDSIRMMFAK